LEEKRGTGEPTGKKAKKGFSPLVVMRNVTAPKMVKSQARKGRTPIEIVSRKKAGSTRGAIEKLKEDQGGAKFGERG